MPFDPTVAVCLCARAWSLTDYRELRYLGVLWISGQVMAGAEVRRCSCGRLLAMPVTRNGAYVDSSSGKV